MRVSIIIPLFHGQKYLNGLFQIIENNRTVLRKNNRTISLEVIIVNDAEDEFIEASGIGVIVINNEKNIGIHASRVKGLERATGEYVLFLDQDDNITDDYIYSQLESIGKADAVVCNGYYREQKRIFFEEPTINRNWFISRTNLIISPGQVLMKSASIPEEWKKQIVHIQGADDAFLWILLGAHNANVVMNNRVLYTHVEDGENTSFNWSRQAESLEQVLYFVKKLKILTHDEEQQCEKSIQSSLNKLRSYTLLEEKWKLLHKRKLDLSIYFKNKDIKKVAIYGYGVIGRKVLNELTEYGIPVAYMVDQDTTYEGKKIKVCSPSERLEKVEAMIVTPVFAFKEIERKLMGKDIGDILSLDNILEDLLEGRSL